MQKSSGNFSVGQKLLQQIFLLQQLLLLQQLPLLLLQQPLEFRFMSRRHFCSSIAFLVTAVIPILTFAQSTSIQLPKSSRPTTLAFLPTNSRGIPSTFSPATSATRAKLYRLPTASFSNQVRNLRQLASVLQSAGFQVFIDESALEEERIDLDTEIKLSQSVHSLGNNIELALSQINLSLLIENELLLITTIEGMEERMIPVIYDITDFAPKSSYLINSIQSNVDSLMWEDNGGGAGVTITLSKIRNRQLITVTGPSTLQFKVQSYLQSLSQLTRHRSIATITETTPDIASPNVGSQPVGLPR